MLRPTRLDTPNRDGRIAHRGTDPRPPGPARLRSTVLACLFALPIVCACVGSATAESAPLRLPSRDGTLTGILDRTAEGVLTWSLERTGRVVVAESPLGITVDGVDLGRRASPGTPAARNRDETYPWRGVKRTAVERCREYVVPMRSGDADTPWQLEVRVFEDGFAFRYRIPGTGRRRIQGESTAWTLAAGTPVWFQTNTGDYEGAYQRRAVESVPTTNSNDRLARPVHLGPPVTVELPEGGFMLLTEANLRRYGGMTLRPTGTARLLAAFEDDPGGFELEGEILSPWRVTVVADDLDALVNADVVPNLADAPDPRLFSAGARTDWIRPGRALITWCVFGNDGAQWPLQKWFVDRCAALRCE
ncbi:MAG: glycoside hydrolase family 97 N-terminal domain-containing protein, partial [Verrucomicrobiales bacterium]|nr:glycoside hydrolase family 97 N-terminal domain-containing protein [Verrucomicrobiales bacterium]